jgi:DNA-binding SARP family transcriptional activator/ABC-type transport system substrate-binding protein
MDLQLLGPVEARLGDHPLPLGARKQRALLAMLGLEVNRTVSVERLAEGLWGDAQPSSAAKMVQHYVMQLRRVLAGSGAAIVTHGRGYELRAASDAVDVLLFEQLMAASRPREALALWRGETLADVEAEPFAAAEIRRLEEQRVRAHELAIEQDLDAGRAADVVGELETLVESHPLRERLHAQRMLALYRAGRQSEALQAYRQARSELVGRVGVEPGPELQGLHRAILEHDPALDPHVPAAPARPPPATELPRARRRRMILLAGAAVVSLAAGLIAFGVSRVTAPDRVARIGENMVGVVETDGRISRADPVGADPVALATGDGSVWAASSRGIVSRLEQHRIVDIPVGGEPTAVAFGAGSLWVANGERRTVAQIDPTTNAVVNRLRVGNASRGIAVGAHALWVTSAVDGVVRRIDLGHPEVSHRISVGGNPTAIAAGARAIWVANEEGATVTRLDPRTGSVVKPIQVGNGPSAVAVGAGAVWAVSRADGTLYKIDPHTNVVAAVSRVGSDPSAVAAGDGGVWVGGGGEGTVLQIDAGTARVRHRFEVKSGVSALALADGAVSVAAVAPPAAHRGGTLRVVRWAASDEKASVDWLERDAYSAASAQITSLAFDGLVAYRRTAGAAGATIVGALATEVPEPRDRGRTYRFTLRPGLRFSNGAPVRPEDFRASIERFLQATRRKPLVSEFLTRIVGVRRCLASRVRCDLSAGIQTDPRARTITVRLTRPDTEFLHQLTFQFAYVVPAQTPRRRTGDQPPPGTGPYRFATWSDKRGGTMVRNPHFRQGAAQSRPDGFADRIKVTVEPLREKGRSDSVVAHAVARVARGEADLAVLANPFGPIIPPGRIAALRTSAPAQVHSYPEAVLNHMFLNVRRRPFDDVRVRRALNFATDRARIVALEGGSALATSTCQILPAGFPGYRPYCPYTAHRGAGRAWSAPDPQRARALVAASGTAGMRVRVTVPPFQRDVGRYFARLLDRLGFRASLRVLDQAAYFETIYTPGSRIQIGFNGYSLDYASPSTFFEPNFGCLKVLSQLCDHKLMREIEAARAARGDAAGRRWAAIDRRVTDLAPAVPLTNRRSMDVVSRRVGNVQHHLMGYTMLDRLWVR